MSTKGTKNQGVKVYIGTKAADGTTDTYTQVKRCKMIGEFGAESSIIDATALEDAAKEKLKGIPDFGNIELGGNRVFTETGQNALQTAAADTDDDPYNFRILFPGEGTGGGTPDLRFTFKAIVTKFKENTGQVDALVEFSSTLAVSGAIASASVA